jgi:RNA polymerase sigma factor for flagellar operon FliA
MALEVEQLWTEYKRGGDLGLREELVERYTSLVRYVVERVGSIIPPGVYQNRREDLLSAGLIGLMEAIEKFKPQLQVRFESYSGRRIYGAVMDELRDMDWAPRSLRKKARQVEAVYRELEREQGSSASEADVAERLGISRQDLSKWLNDVRAASLLSLDGVVVRGKDGGQATLAEMVSDQKAIDPADRLEQQELVGRLAKHIDELQEVERTVISLYYYDKLTLKEIGQVLEVSESRVSQLCSRAVIKLRAKLVDTVEV